MTRLRDCEGFHRRDFLKVGTAGLLGLALPDVLRAEARPMAGKRRKKADSVILLWLGGGPATIDMWDLKPNAPENIRGDFKPIRTKAAGIRRSSPGISRSFTSARATCPAKCSCRRASRWCCRATTWR